MFFNFYINESSKRRFDGPYEGMPVGNITALGIENAGGLSSNLTLDMIELEDSGMQFWAGSLHGLMFYDGKRASDKWYFFQGYRWLPGINIIKIVKIGKEKGVGDKFFNVGNRKTQKVG